MNYSPKIKILFLSLTLITTFNSNRALAALTDEVLFRIYLDYLGRAPDTEGAAYWKASNVSEVDLIANLVQSEEYKSSIGTIYQNVLNRNPDEAGLNFWVNTRQNLLTIATAIRNSSESKPVSSVATPPTGIEKPVSSVATPPTGIEYTYPCDGIIDRQKRSQCLDSNCYADDGRSIGSIPSSERSKFNIKGSCPAKGCVLSEFKVRDIDPFWQSHSNAVFICPIGTATTNKSVHLDFNGQGVAFLKGTVEEYKVKMAKFWSPSTSAPTQASKPLDEAVKNVNIPSNPMPTLPAATPQLDLEFINGIKNFAYKCLTADTPSSLCESLPKLVELGYELIASEVSQTAQNASSVKYYTASKDSLQIDTLGSHSDIRETARASDQMKFEILRLATPEVGKESLDYGKQNSSSLSPEKKKILSTGLNAYRSSMNVRTLNASTMLSNN